MKITNTSNYPVTVNGVGIETGETEDVEIDDVEKYKNDRRFLLEDDDKSKPKDSKKSKSKDESDDKETSKSKKQKNKGD